MFVKTRLMTPGPTPTAESTRLAMAASQPHHRSAAYSEITFAALEGLRWLWDTDDDVMIMAGSGTAGMEAGLRSALAPGDRVVVVTGGKFAERWLKLARLIGCDVAVLDVPWGRAATVEGLEEILSSGAPPRALVMVASETSTGVLHPVARLAAAFWRQVPDGLVIVDGITAVGCADLSMKRDAIDILVSGSQKAFGLPPGAAVVGVSARAWERIESVDAPSFYLDLRRERKQTKTGQSAFTPPIPLVVGFAEVLGRWQALGREALFAHATTLQQGVLAGARALGLSPFAEVPSPALTSIEMPDTIDVGRLRKRLRDHLGVEVAGGQDALSGRIIRIGHIGVVDALDVVGTIGALELALSEQDWPSTLGAGVAAALSAMAPAIGAAVHVDRVNP
jgi:aspartate aminotransferase-like enzyme